MSEPFDITIDDAEVQAALARLIRRATQTLPAMQDIGRALENLTEDAFEAEGPGWPGLKPKTEKARARRGHWPGQILQETGGAGLAGSLHHTATATKAQVGVSKVYAAIHQFGGTADMAPGPAGIPARPYLPIDAAGALTAEARREAMDILREHLADR